MMAEKAVDMMQEDRAASASATAAPTIPQPLETTA
jgi:hypothetical protein